MNGWRIEPRPWDDPVGAALRRDMRAELDGRYGGNHEPGVLPSATDVTLFLVAVDPDTGAAVGCGALRDLGPTTVEVKRMYVVPAARGSGVAVALLRALEEAAVGRGRTTVRLETGIEQPDAIRFYRREGYREIPAFGHYVGSDLSVCFERRIERYGLS